MTSGVTVDGRSPISIDDLVERVGLGDRAAFDELYRLTASRLLGLVRQVLRDPSQSEEVSQEIYLEVWKSASRYDRAKGRGLTWLFTMAHRQAVDRVRASQASRDRDLRIGVRDHQTAHDSVAEYVEIKYESERMKLAMSALTGIQRQAIELSYFSGCTHAEVALIAGIPVGTAKTRLRDALIKLRTELSRADAAWVSA